MNNHLKLIIYFTMIVGILYFVQDRYELFDISFKPKESTNSEISNESENDNNDDRDQYVEIEIPSGIVVRIDVEVARSDAQKSRGLSGRSFLGDYEGMFFVYDSEISSAFWMKDMVLPLDIIFIDSTNKIVDIKEKQQPCEGNYCPSIYSSEKFMYVLEVNSGFCQENSIEEGYGVVQYLQ